MRPERVARKLKQQAISPKAKREDCSVESWSERDRLGIWITHIPTDKVLAEWWDEEARQMFEDGFFKPGLESTAFKESVLDYAVEMGIVESDNPEHKLLPTLPEEGPPLPRGLKIKWPWKK